MEKIALLTDSSCDLKNEDLKKYDINMLPFRIIYSDREYLDKITISSEEMYVTLHNGEHPTTSLPDLKYSGEVLDRLQEDGYTDIIVVTVSSKLSGTYNSIRLFSEDYPKMRFHFFDSKTLGFPVGAICIEASKLIKENLKVDKIMEGLEDIRKRVNGYVTLDTLEYLIKGGRMGRVQGKLGQILNIKPIIHHSEEGELYPFGKTRGRKQAISKLKGIVDEYLEKGKCRLWILNGDAIEEAKAFYDVFKDNSNVTGISLETIGAAMGIHTGPKALGVCILEENN
ncbi:MAG: DegV family protein [Clostridium sp.]